MYSKFKSFSIMGVSNSEMFLSAEKDLSALELNFLARSRVPTLELHQDHECHNNIAALQDVEVCEEKRVLDLHVKDQAEEEKEEDKCKLFVSSLKIKLPSLGEIKFEGGEEDGDGFKTPTSLDHKIPAILPCPPAPRKPKSRPLTKRKVPQRRILHDLSNEIEALFPPALRADLGNKIKKVRQETHAN